VSLRSATPDDAPALAELFLAARAEAMPCLPVLHAGSEEYGPDALLAWEGQGG
jgi:hypothetical protein